MYMVGQQPQDGLGFFRIFLFTARVLSCDWGVILLQIFPPLSSSGVFLFWGCVHVFLLFLAEEKGRQHF